MGGVVREPARVRNRRISTPNLLAESHVSATVFSTANYSPLTLLPLDPPPFTIPTASTSPRRNQPTVTLEDYPLPDGSWRWVSRAWMIDMRGDGEVQYDGFEYARSFRSKKWSPNPGFMSNRGLVRRRRWIRLMMRPAQALHEAASVLEDAGALSGLPELEHHEEGATRPPSVLLTATNDSEDDIEVWRGDAGDWQRCHLALRRIGWDGRKLELWARWLGVPGASRPASRVSSLNPVIAPFAVVSPEAIESGKRITSRTLPSVDGISTSSSQSGAAHLTAESRASLAPAPKERVAAVIRRHGSDILSLFVYPDSRAQFISLLAKAGLLQDLRAGLGISDSMQFLDFWSYTKDLSGDSADALKSS
ncbi:hypothetical protein BD309DRAFT_987385 [Dichomitus squalens]|nr:hypothetical protein BD309DRAFT_987385 [Dichomitus squalens]